MSKFFCPNLNCEEINSLKEMPYGIGQKPLCQACNTPMKFWSLETPEPDLIKLEPDIEVAEVEETKNRYMYIHENTKAKEIVEFDSLKGSMVFDVATTEFEIDVAESAIYSEGIIVCKNKTGKKLHFRKGERELINGQEFTNLIPLNIDELKNLKIEESYNETYFSDITFEE